MSPFLAEPRPLEMLAGSVIVLQDLPWVVMVATGLGGAAAGGELTPVC